MSDTWLHILIGFGAWAIGGVFTAGGFYIYVRMSLTHLEKWAHESHVRLEGKIDKNYETLEARARETVDQLKMDLSGVGMKVSRVERENHRRYHNFSVAMMLAVPEVKEKQVSKLMKEEVAS